MARRSIIWFLAAAIVAAAPAASGQTKADTDEGYVHIKDIPYTSAGETDPYKTERCKLDLYFPEGEEGFPTLVWFHGGGLETGSKSLQDGFRRQGFAVADVNYRLFPVEHPVRVFELFHRCICPVVDIHIPDCIEHLEVVLVVVPVLASREQVCTRKRVVEES